MCGLVGVWRPDGAPVTREELARARDRMTHRGPDDAGLHVEPGVGLGHRRLSIIDLSPAGRMPMANETEDVWAVFNGEIYNFATLRDELERAGHVFRSRTDSEVVIHAYEQWGIESFARFDGMFAIAIWDRKARRVVLARDITGEKPLFYRTGSDRSVIFASTLDAMLAFPEIARDVDPEAMRLYAELGFVPAPRSIIRGVAKVEPGTAVVFDGTSREAVHTYWSLERVVGESARQPASLAQATDELETLLREAVTSRLVADVPLGAFLSGGIDSSLVVAMMAKSNARTVRTFTIGFREQAFDESEHAHRVAKHLGVENTTIVLSAADVLAELPAVTGALDEPMADYSVLPSLAVARLARRHVTVALTGDGADEAFGGYRYYAATRLFEGAAKVVPQPARAVLAASAGMIGNERFARALRRASSSDAAAFFGRSGFYRGATAGPLLRALVRRDDARPAPDEAVASFVRAHPRLRPTEAGMLWDATHTLPDAWLVKVDRTSMAVGLETRAPFLDRRVLEYAFHLPLDHRVRGSNQKKIILRSLLSRYLPRELFERPKQGFTAPMRSWFANELHDELHDRLAVARVKRLEIFDPDVVQRALAEQGRGSADHTQLLWALLLLDRWYEQRIEGR